MKTQSPQSESFSVQRHGDIAVITPAPEVESMPDNIIQQAADLVLAPLKSSPPAGVVVDLSRVSFFGSVFISFLLRCHMMAKKHGTEMVLAGCSSRARELLHLTALDTLWALYANVDEAIASLGSSD